MWPASRCPVCIALWVRARTIRSVTRVKPAQLSTRTGGSLIYSFTAAALALADSKFADSPLEETVRSELVSVKNSLLTGK